MTTVAPFSLFSLFRTTSVVLFALSLLWIFVSLLIFRDVLVSQLLALVTLLAAGVLGLLIYVRSYRLKLQYDEHGFALFSGQNQKAAGQWKNFERVALFHRGYASFAVRLYAPDKTYVDIPVSELRLDPDKFRRFTNELIKQNVTTDEQ